MSSLVLKGVGKRFGGLLPGGQLLGLLHQALSLELAWSGQPLWLHRP